MHLPIWKTTVDILDYCWNERETALRFGVIPVAIIFLAAATARFTGIDPNTFWKTNPLLGVTLLLVLPTLAYLPLTVSWYRRVVMGPEGASGRPLFALGRLEWRILGWQIVLGLLLGAVLSISAAVVAGIAFGINLAVGQIAAFIVGGVLGIAVLVLFVAAACRVSIISAMVATEHEAGLKRAWRMTRGIGLRMTGILILILLAAVLAWALVKIAAFLLGVVLGLVSPAPMEDIVVYVTLAGEAIAGFLGFLFSATLFGFVYRGLETEPGAAEVTAAEPVAPGL